MDVQMPVMDGFEATGIGRWSARQETHSHRRDDRHAMKGDQERCLQSGMDDYLATRSIACDSSSGSSAWPEVGPMAEG